MPKRPDTHVVGDLALSRVMQICNSCEWACEVVHKDYGDDLLVQPNYEGVIDHNRIWIQIKGTRNMSRFFSSRFGYSIKVSSDHALKWVRSADLVAIVLWDVEKDYGLWSLPKECLREFDWRVRKNEIRIIFDENSLFNKDQAIKIGWKSRISHYENILDSALMQDERYKRLERIGKSESDYKSLAPLIIFDFLKLIGILQKGKTFDERLISSFQENLAFFEREFSGLSEEMKNEALLAAVLGRLIDATNGCEVSPTLSAHCFNLTKIFMKIDGTW